MKRNLGSSMIRRECLPLNLSPSSMVTQRMLPGLLVYVWGRELISKGWASQNMHIRTDIYDVWLF